MEDDEMVVNLDLGGFNNDDDEIFVNLDGGGIDQVDEEFVDIDEIEFEKENVDRDRDRKRENNEEKSSIENSPKKRKISTDIKIDKLGSPLKKIKKNKSPQKNIFEKAIDKMNISLTKEVVGREKEIKKLTTFCVEKIDNRESGTFYINGKPGIGKSLSVNNVMNKLRERYESKIRVVELNCALSPSTLLKDILLKLYGRESIKSKSYAEDIERILRKKIVKMNIIILDEVDRLISQQETKAFKRLIEMTKDSDNRLILISLANNPELSNKNLKDIEFDRKIIFSPYTAEQLENIIKNRLKEENLESLFDPKAISYIARKMEGDSGDIRKVINILKEALVIKSKNYDPQKAESISKVNMVIINQIWQKNNTLAIRAIEDLSPFAKILLLSSNLITLDNMNKKTTKTNFITISSLRDKFKSLCGMIGVNETLDHKFSESLSSLKGGSFVLGENKIKQALDLKVIPFEDLEFVFSKHNRLSVFLPYFPKDEDC